ETAVPYALLQQPEVRDFVSQQVANWNVPLLTGTMDVRNVVAETEAASEAQGRLPQGKKEESKLFNAALVLEPRPASAGQKDHVSSSAVYHKQVLMPMVERVPFSDRFPKLARLAFDLGVRGGLDVGRERTVISFH